MCRRLRIVVLTTLSTLVLGVCRGDEEAWPQFRGPSGQGESASRQLPLTWDREHHIAWKTEIPGRGWSSPVVVDRRVFLTTAIKSGGDESDSDTEKGDVVSLQLVCLDEMTGDTLFRTVPKSPRCRLRRRFIPRTVMPVLSTPIVSGDRVYAHFGTFGTAALTLDGDIVWNRTCF